MPLNVMCDARELLWSHQKIYKFEIFPLFHIFKSDLGHTRTSTYHHTNSLDSYYTLKMPEQTAYT